MLRRRLFWLARHAAKVYARLMLLGVCFILAGGQVVHVWPPLRYWDGARWQCCLGQDRHHPTKP